MSKDPNYISNKLSELKKTALQSNDERIRMANPTTSNQYSMRANGYNDISDGRQGNLSLAKQNIGGNVIDSDINNIRTRKDYTNQPNTISLDDYKQRLERDNPTGSAYKESYRVIDNTKKYEPTSPKVTYKSFTNIPNENGYRNYTDEPRVIKARNVQTPNVNNTYMDAKNNYTDINANYIGTSIKPSNSYSVDKFRQTTPMASYESTALKNLAATGLMDRYKVNMTEDLNGRLQECTEINRKLASEINELKRALEAEKVKTKEVEKMCIEDLQETRGREQEAQKDLSDIERKHQDRIKTIKKHEDLSYNVG